MNTVQLFNETPYETDFDACVISCTERNDKNGIFFDVILDKTMFFPEQGGQSPDTGTINNIAVTDVQIKNGIITHVLNAPVMEGSSVHGKINWQHRFFNMQQHSGEHIFSGIVHNTFGYDNVGFHLSDQSVTMDFSGPLSDEDINNIEYEVNRVITSNLPVEISYPSDDELKTLEYRSKKELTGQIRIVTIPGVDVCACCAPHVRRTGEIGFLKVIDHMNYKGGVRIFILCGFRALNNFREKQAIIKNLSQKLSVQDNSITGAVDRLENLVASQKNEIISLGAEVLNSHLNALDPLEKNVILFENALENLVVRNAINMLIEKHDGICGIFMGNDENGYSYIIGSKNTDCKAVSSLLREKLSAKGGGSSIMIQGSLKATKESIIEILSRC